MRINNKLLRSRLSGSAKHCQFLDLSSLSLDHIEGLDAFVKLQTLKLCRNNISFVCNLEYCTNIWNLDLSHNQIQNLEGLERFLALGTLLLSGNNLTWSELTKIQHMHILNLNLHSNPLLQKDPYYRLHVIDCLPNVWMLDGRIITSGERIQVEQFFNDSALGEHPVRHKLPKKRFTPSVLSQRGVSGVFGEKAVHLLTRFSSVSQLNRELDWKRLQYLAYNIQEDLQLEAYYTKVWHAVLRKHPTFLEHLISARDLDRSACNMILLLLVAGLEFSIPDQLLQDALSHAKLHTLGSLETIGLFMLPSETRCSTVSLLLSAAKVDRDSGEDGGLYDKLYLSLYFCVSELAQCNYRPTADTQGVTGASKQLIDSRSLVAAEIVQLFCIVPTFFDYITKDSGVMKIVTMATGCHDMVQVVRSALQDLEANQMKEEERYVVIADLLLSSIQKNILDICQSRPSGHGFKEHFALKTGKCIPRKPVPVSLAAADYQSQGRPSPRRTLLYRSTSAKLERRNPCSKSADLGDRILLGPQVIGRIISIPEPDLVLVQLPEIPVDSGAMLINFQDLGQHYTYQDLDELCWDIDANYWRIKGTKGDRITFRKISDDELKSRPATASAISSAIRRKGTILPPGAVPLTHQSVTECLPSVAATYKASHQLSLVIPLTDVHLLGKEVPSNNSGTGPTRPNSASSDHSHGKMSASEDEEAALADQSQESVAEDPGCDDADSQLTETGREETEESDSKEKEVESNEDGNMGQSNNNSNTLGVEQRYAEEQAEETQDDNSNSSTESEINQNIFDVYDTLNTAEHEDNPNPNEDEDNKDLNEDADNQDVKEDADNQDLNGDDDNQDLKEDEDNQDLNGDEDNQDIKGDEENQDLYGDEDKQDLMEDEDSLCITEHEGKQEEDEENQNIAQYGNNHIETEDEGNRNITEHEGNGESEDGEGNQITAEHEVTKKATEVEEDDQNATAELDPNENTLENNYETERSTEEKREILSDGGITSLPAKSTAVTVGENESKTELETVENTLPEETGVKDPMKHAYTARNGQPATRGQNDKAIDYSTNEANKRVMVSSSDRPSGGDGHLVMEGDSHQTEEATTFRKNIGAVRFLDPPSALRVDQDRVRRNYPVSTRWLGEGRDLHLERTVRHPRHIPGWMEGLTFRPSTSLSTKRLMQYPGQSSSGQSSSEGTQRRRIGSRSAPAYGRPQTLVTTFEVLDLFKQKKILPSTYNYNQRGKLFQASPSMVRGISQLQPRILPASTSKTRALPMCRECRKKHGRREPCFRAAFSAIADDADAMPYDEFFRLHLPSPSGAEEHML